MKWPSLLIVAACGPGLAVAPKEPKLPAREMLVRDAATLKTMMHDSVVNGGLRFDDAACMRAFGTPGEVPSERFGAFARCLAGLKLVASAREDSLADVVVLEHAPGFELEARVTPDGQLTWIGFASRVQGEPDVPTITHAALEQLRLAGDRDATPDPAVVRDLELDTADDSKAAYTWFKICLAPTGAITKAEPYLTTSSQASKAFGHMLAAWKFRPFVMRGTPLGVCTLVRLAYPKDQAPVVETLPLPPPQSRSKKRPVVLATSKLLEGKRIAGNRAIAPADLDKLRIQRAGITEVTGTFRLCLDDTGTVESVLPMRSTGIAGYDARIIAAMHDWRYAPYQVDDLPVPVCTAVRFRYTQH